MKKLVVVLALCALGWGGVNAQGNGNGGGNNNSGNNGNGNASQQGQQIPLVLAMKILKQAYPFFHAQFGITPGQLLAQYQLGNCGIVLIETNPPSGNAYKVSYGGVHIVIMDDNL